MYPISAQTNRELLLLFETDVLTGCGENAPFWHTSNRQGLPSIDNSNGFIHCSILGSQVFGSGFSIGHGIDIVAGAGLEKSVFVHQLFLDLDYKRLELSIGMKERWGDKNKYLSTGSLTWSGNCQPIPEIRVGIPDYEYIPIGGNWLSFKGHIGYGRLTDDTWRKVQSHGKYADGILFHSKSLFLRFGNERRFPMKMTLGLEMNNLFGGTIHRVDYDRKMQSDALAYWTVLFPFHKIEKQGHDDGDNLGSWHLDFSYNIDNWHIKTYYEHFYEDHSSMLGIEYKNNIEGEKRFIFYGFRRNWFDGLFGIEINAPEGSRYFRNAVFEYLNTRGQSGPVCHSIANNIDGMYVVEEIDGCDAMYNHSAYDSYTHHGYAIGNPVLISPVYNKNGSEHFRSNRVKMFHIGVNGGITPCIEYRVLTTTTQHWGQYSVPLNEVERVTSLMLECSYKFDGEYGWRVSLSGAMDFDSGSDGSYLLGNNRGLMVTVNRTWKVR